MDRSLHRRVREFLFSDFAPAAKVILVLQLALFVVSLFSRFENALVLDSFRFFRQPWTVVTWWLVNDGVIDLLFAALWWWFIAGSMERTWGTRRFVIAWIVIVISTGAGLLLGSALSRTSFEITRWFPAIAGLTVSWAMTHAGQEVMLYGLFAVKSRWLAWLSAGLMVVSYAAIHPLAGLLSLSGCGAGYLLARAWRGPRRNRPRRPRGRLPSRLRRVK